MHAYADQYSTRQKLASLAALRAGMTSVEVARRAEQGLLHDDAGPVESFRLRPSTLRDWRSRERDVAAVPLTPTQELPPRDAVEKLRLDLIGVAEAVVSDLKRQVARGHAGKLDLERLRQAGRCVREVAALPGRDDPRPVAPGDKIPGGGGATNGDKTRGGLAGQILAAARSDSPREPEPAPEREPPTPAPEPLSERDALAAKLRAEWEQRDDG
jgi:hypothetical protein